MARGNGRTINVKIPTIKVINALESKLDQIKADYDNQEANETKYKKLVVQWEKQVKEFAIDNINKATNFRTNYRAWNGCLNVDFDLSVEENKLPKYPERDFEQFNGHNYRDTVEEIENAIRILKLTDEETVSTSTYNSIARYL